jgi:hypothetical protein
MKKVLAGAAGVLVLAVLIAGAVFADPDSGTVPGPGRCSGCGEGRGPGMQFNAAAVETVTAQVLSVEQVTGRRGAGRGVALSVKAGNETLSVHLGPAWFLDEQPLRFAAGDTVAIKGSHAFRRGQDIFLAQEVTKDGTILKLRDENGVPVWAGQRRCVNRS